jgi:uncharacterized protein YfiM (DUF2279 family)
LNFALAFVIAVGGGGANQPPPDRWFAPDKVKHFFMSAFVQSVAYSGIRATGRGGQSSLIGATVVTGITGVGKELWDARRGGTASVRDLVWDAAGAGAASALIVRTSR